MAATCQTCLLRVEFAELNCSAVVSSLYNTQIELIRKDLSAARLQLAWTLQGDQEEVAWGNGEMTERVKLEMEAVTKAMQKLAMMSPRNEALKVLQREALERVRAAKEMKDSCTHVRPTMLV